MGNDNLNFDLGFIDKDLNKKKQSKPDENNAEPSVVHRTLNQKKSNSNRTVILVIVGVICFFVVVNLFSDDTTIEPKSNTNQIQKSASQDNDYVIFGEYRCLTHHYNKAISIRPSDEEQSSLSSRDSRLLSRQNQLDILENEIENTYVDEYSQLSVDNYNNKINSYNSKLLTLQSDMEKLDQDFNNYNLKVDKYNNYLDNNCTKIK